MPSFDLSFFFGAVYLLLNTWGFVLTKSKTTKLTLASANLTMVFQALLLGSFATAIVAGFTALRLAIAAFTTQMSPGIRHLFFMSFIIGQTLLCAWFWKGIQDLLPLAIGYFATWFFLYLDNKAMRFAALGTCLMWFINGILIGSWALAAGQVLAAIAIIHSLIKLSKNTN